MEKLTNWPRRRDRILIAIELLETLSLEDYMKIRPCIESLISSLSVKDKDGIAYTERVETVNTRGIVDQASESHHPGRLQIEAPIEVSDVKLPAGLRCDGG